MKGAQCEGPQVQHPLSPCTPSSTDRHIATACTQEGTLELGPFLAHHRKCDSEILLHLYRLIVSSFVSFLISLYDLILVFLVDSLLTGAREERRKPSCCTYIGI